MSKDEMAQLISYSADAIHSWEIERLRLSAKAASKINQATGVSTYWLLNGTPQNPIENDRGDRWNIDFFKQIQSEPFEPKSEVTKFYEVAPSFYQDCIGLLGSYKSAFDAKRLPILRYEFSEFRKQAQKSYGYDETAIECYRL